MKTMTKKAAEKFVEAAFKRVGSNRQFDVMDLGKIHKAGMDALNDGKDVEVAVKDACDKYEKK